MIYIIPPTHLSLYRFLREKVGKFLSSKVGKLHSGGDDWLRWHCERLFFVAAGDGNDIVGAAAFRTIKGTEYAEDDYHFDRGPGSIIWIDSVAAIRPDVPIRLWRAGIDLLGRNYDKVAFFQGRRGQRLRVHDSARFTKRLNQIAGGKQHA